MGKIARKKSPLGTHVTTKEKKKSCKRVSGCLDETGIWEKKGREWNSKSMLKFIELTFSEGPMMSPLK